MTSAGSSRQKNKFIFDRGLKVIGHLNASLLPDVLPDFDEVTRRLGRKNVAKAHSSLAFARWLFNRSSGIPSPRWSWSTPSLILDRIGSRLSSTQRSCSSWVSSSRNKTSSALLEPVD